MDNIKINKIIRSKRKTVALIINSDATLTVRAPVQTPISYIEKLINKKKNWIEKKVKEIISRPQPIKKEFVNGEEFNFLGKNYRLRVINISTIMLGEYLYFPISKKQNIKEELIVWYKQQAKKIVKSRLDLYAKKTSLKYSSMRISNAKKRWGSCGKNNSIIINWRLIMTPLQVIDYVIVHELVHIDEKNHSKRFWSIVKAIFPGYNYSKEWLKKNGHLLNI
jgi:predicted metal-dependent hydrolase